MRNVSLVRLCCTVLLSFSLLQSAKAAAETNSYLVNFCKVWGLAKYYHPATDQATDYWDSEFLAYYPIFNNIQSPEEFNTELLHLIDKLDSWQKPTLKVTTEDMDLVYANKIVLTQRFQQVKHIATASIIPDFSWINNNLFSDTVKARLCQILLGHKPYKKSFITGKTVLRHNENNYENIDSITTPYKMLALFRFWNTIQYFSPYKRYINQSWDSTLVKYIPLFKSNRPYIKCLMNLNAEINDSHSFYSPLPTKIKTSKLSGYKSMPFYVVEIGGSYFVKQVCWKNCILQPGDELLKIDTLNLKSNKEGFARYHSSSTPQALSNKYCRAIENYAFKDSINITFKRGEVTYVKMLKQGATNNERLAVHVPSDTINYAFINDSIGYLNLVGIKPKNVKKAFKAFQNTQSLIIDLRGYPNGLAPTQMVKWLSKKPVEVAAYDYPKNKNPGFFFKNQETISFYYENFTFGFLKYVGVLPNAKLLPNFNKTYAGQVVVLIDADAISAAETAAMILQAYVSNVVFVGQPTTGANGDISFINLPGHHRFTYTSLDWHYPNGKQLQRIGIQPDILIDPTAQDLKAGGDFLLDKTIAYIVSGKIAKSGSKLSDN
jgi:carboxyl-terminal processing protease